MTGRIDADCVVEKAKQREKLTFGAFVRQEEI